MASEASLERFLAATIDLPAFTHQEHVRMAFELLRRHDFPQAACLYSGALKRLTLRAGRPEVFHQTVTIAFLSLIAEAMAPDAHASFPDWLRAHPELLDRSVLTRWYRPGRLASPLARATFVLP